MQERSTSRVFFFLIVYNNVIMADERSIFERLDSIETQNNEIIRLLSDSEKQKQSQNQTIDQKPELQISEQEALRRFLKLAQKSFMWFGTKTKFYINKIITAFSFLMLIVLGIVSTNTTSMSCGTYSTFSLFENIWVIFGIFLLVYSVKAKRIYEVNDLAANNPNKGIKDELGMIFFSKEKIAFKVFNSLAIIAVALNIIAIWWIKPSGLSATATIMEVLFFVSIVVSSIMNARFFGNYSIIHVEGKALTNNEVVVLVLPPGAKELMLEEDFKQMMPSFYE